MKFNHTNLLFFSLPIFCLVLIGCQEAPPPADKTPVVEATSELPVATDAIEHTRNNNPEVVDQEKLPQPDLAREPTADKPGKEVAKTKPAKPAVDATSIKDKPVVAQAPAPRPAVTTPATAPAPTTPPAPATAPKTEPTEVPQEAVKVDHTAWNNLLQRHVNVVGNVNYAAFKKDEAKLDTYLATLAESTPNGDWSRNEAMAYWINAYNGFTIKRILQAYPVKSIMDLDGGKPWDKKWIKLGGNTYSLNQIEHEILRPKYGDARIHFAVNCAAASCPPIPNEAFTADNLNSLLQRRARSFIRNKKYNQTEGEVMVSKIFDWYGEDFGDLRNYLNKYLKSPIPEGQKIGFLDYDWALNKQ